MQRARFSAPADGVRCILKTPKHLHFQTAIDIGKMRSFNFHTTGYKLAAFWMIHLCFLASCSEKDDAARIRQLIEQGAKLAEKQDINGLMNLTTEDFLASPGKHDRREVKAFIWIAFRRYKEFRVLHHQPAIDFAEDGKSALVKVKFLIVKKDQTLPDLRKLWDDPKRWLEEFGENADLYRLKLECLKKNGDWLVKKARLESFRGLGFSE